MGIDELRALQKSQGEWQSYASQLRSYFISALSTIERDLEARTGLRLWVNQTAPRFEVYGSGATLEHGTCLTVNLAGFSDSYWVDVLDANFERTQDGLWKIIVREEDLPQVDDKEITLTEGAPFIPIRIQYKVYLLWRGPEDTIKIIDTIIAMIDGKPCMASEFSMDDPKAPQLPGCLLPVLALLLFASVCELLAVF